jgi:hypothetical protein
VQEHCHIERKAVIRGIMLKRFAAVSAAVILIKYIFYILDPYPQFYGGDSFSYLGTNWNVWIPQDRSFVYGLFVLRNLAHLGHSLTYLIVIQTGAGIIACLLLYYCAFRLFHLPYSISFALACLFAADPIQLLYERQIMAETLGGLFLAAALTVGLSYLKKPRAWKLLLIPFLGVLSTAFRLNSYAPAWFLSLSLPVLLLLKSLFTRHSRSDATENIPQLAVRDRYRLAVHLVIGAACFLTVLNQYTHYYGRLVHRRHEVTYSQGFFMLSGLYDIVVPKDAPDSRLAEIIATKIRFYPGGNPVLERNMQRYGNGGLISRWEKVPIDGPETLHDEIAKQTALNAILRAPLQVLREALSNCWLCLSDMKARVLDIFDTAMPITEEQSRWIKQSYGLAVTKDWKEKSTLTKTLLMKCRGWFYVLLLSPIWGLAVAALFRKTDHFIPLLVIAMVGILDFLPSCIFVVTNARLLHPLDFGVFLMLGPIVSHVVQHFAQSSYPSRQDMR